MSDVYLKEWGIMVELAEINLQLNNPQIEDEVIVWVNDELTAVRGLPESKLSDWIYSNFNSVYNAAKQTGKSETQLHRWIKKGALIDSEGNVWTKPSGGNLNAAR